MGLLAGKTLAVAVAPGDTHLTITPPLALGDNPAGQPIQIGTELMMVTGGKRAVLGLARAADSAHLSGVAITELNPFVASPEGGGGAIAVDNTVDPPAEVTTIIAVGAEIDGDEATLRGKDFYAQDTDPGAVGAGSVWKDTGATPEEWWKRNPTNDGWIAHFEPLMVGVEDEDVFGRSTATAMGTGNATTGAISDTGGGSGIADSRSRAAALTGSALAGPVAQSDDGIASAGPVATTAGTGNADATANATAEGSGDAEVTATAEAATGTARAGSMATRGAVTMGMYAEIDALGEAKLGFNDVAANGGVVGQVVPLTTPDVQDVIDALVALGLITQSD